MGRKSTTRRQRAPDEAQECASLGPCADARTSARSAVLGEFRGWIEVVGQREPRYPEKVTVARPHGLLCPVAAALSVLLASMVAAPVAHADEVSACVSAAEKGQVLRDEGHLSDARAEFASCGADRCPPVVRKECLRWLSELDARLPEVVVQVKTRAGADVVGAAVTLDGAPQTAASLGRALRLDPGPHVFRADHPDFEPAAQDVIVREGERGRVVTITLKRRGEDATGAPREVKRPVPWLTWALGGVSVAGFAAFGGFWASGMGDVSNMRASCAPYCTSEQIDEVRPKLDIARVSLGVGGAAALAAIVVYLTRPSVEVESPKRPPVAQTPWLTGAVR